MATNNIFVLTVVAHVIVVGINKIVMDVDVWRNLMIIINFTEDGVIVKNCKEGFFLADLNNGEFGENPKFLDQTDIEDINGFKWPLGILLIKGDIVVPKAKQVVKEYIL
jgi:hypothetical protein